MQNIVIKGWMVYLLYFIIYLFVFLVNNFYHISQINIYLPIYLSLARPSFHSFSYLFLSFVFSTVFIIFFFTFYSFIRSTVFFLPFLHILPFSLQSVVSKGFLNQDLKLRYCMVICMSECV